VGIWRALYLRDAVTGESRALTVEAPDKESRVWELLSSV
jgi:hypothetical protein